MAELDQLMQTFKTGRLPHGILISGHGGNEFAWSLAQILLCDNENACGTCGPCLRVKARQSEAVLAIEPEKGVIKLEAAAKINSFLALSRVTKLRLILVQDAHLLNVQATNAILKQVEEPPPATHFIFVSPDAGLLLPTLRSRLQLLKLKSPARVADEELTELRQPVLQFLTGCLNRDSSASRTLLDALDGREQSEKAVRCLQEILRDWSVQGESESLTGVEGGVGNWPEWSPRARVELWRRAHRLEGDIHHNVDRALAFENFYQQAPGAVHAVD